MSLFNRDIFSFCKMSDSVRQASLEVIEPDAASLWWAGKEMVRGKKLCDFVGKNEKTKIVCKLQKVSRVCLVNVGKVVNI